MPEETTLESQPAQQQIQVAVDERDIRTLPANFFRFGQTAEEVILDMILQMPNPNPAPGAQSGQAQLLFKVQDRFVLSYPAIKRLNLQLTQLIKRYEQQFGEIAVQPAQRKA